MGLNKICETSKMKEWECRVSEVLLFWSFTSLNIKRVLYTKRNGLCCSRHRLDYLCRNIPVLYIFIFHVRRPNNSAVNEWISQQHKTNTFFLLWSHFWHVEHITFPSVPHLVSYQNTFWHHKLPLKSHLQIHSGLFVIENRDGSNGGRRRLNMHVLSCFMFPVKSTGNTRGRQKKTQKGLLFSRRKYKEIQVVLFVWSESVVLLIKLDFLALLTSLQ